MPNYTKRNTGPLKPKLPTHPADLARLRQQNNPRREPVGHFTGRCAHCGSSNLWDDNLAYGCNGCGAMLGGN
ncbi:hypothetical protein [Methylibium sp.]|uniref:hypothetical protein n=1 Tax=Methylibium sp. TaxID=2067992 RepID=UPI003D12C3DD